MWISRAVWDEIVAEREAWRKERSELLARIQAPEVATQYLDAEPSDEPLYIPYDNDAAHDQYVEDRAAGLVN